VDEYTDSVATGDDFKEWLEAVSGMDFTDFFDQWYYGEGYPIFDISWHQDAENLYITSTQTTSTQVTTLFKMLVPYHIKFDDGTDTTLLLRQDANVNAYTVALDKTVSEMELDPDQWILHRLNSLLLVVEESENPAHFTLGPNPARDVVRVFLTQPKGSDYELRISDLTGRVLHRRNVVNAVEMIELSDYSSGIYLISLTDGAYRVKRKLIIE
jgi:hypothetical protein